MKLAIYGAGGNGRCLSRFVNEINEAERRWDEILFADDVTAEQSIMGHRVYPFAELTKIFSPGQIEFVIAVGEPADRRMLFERVGNTGYNLCEAIVADKRDLKYNSYGKGVVVNNNARASVNVTVGDNTCIGYGSTVGHDSVYGKHSLISTNVTIGGFCTFGDSVFVGMNATVKDHTTIGSNVYIGMGACVYQDLPDGVKVLGNPARIVPGTPGQKVFG